LPEAAVDEAVETGEQESAARPFWSGTISFGLVSIPVNLFPANRSSHVGVRTLAADGAPLRRRYFSASTGRELPPDDTVRGYEIESGRYVTVSDDELDKLAPEKSRDIDLRRFVNLDQIPPLYFERGYFLAPDADSTKAYQLLAAVMEKTRQAGIATFVMRGKEYLIAIVAEHGILRAETMRFQDEIRTPADIGLPEKPEVPASLVRRFEQIIQQRAADELSLDDLHDEAAAALMRIVKSKQAHKENVVVSSEASTGSAESTGLLEMLKQSLEGHGRPRPKAKKAPTGHRPRRQPTHRPARPKPATKRTAQKRG